LQADGGGNKRTIGQDLSQGKWQVGNEPAFDDVAQGAHSMGCAHIVGIVVDGKENDLLDHQLAYTTQLRIAALRRGPFTR
jgi:hypothetical protein